MNTNCKISSKKPASAALNEYCFQSYFTQKTQPPQSLRTPSKKVLGNNGNNLQVNPTELKFKIESVGVHPENDDDLDMCPARVRPSWPKKIIPWWVATSPDEKPPYSYATLIAHAILSSKDGRLTLNDIYTWIASNYPAFSIGNGGWQNSIRHNLSLNKKWFCKIDRRPTQANPGKGCYWTLVAGTEKIFIDNLTQEGGHSRKHHDIGLTAELSIRQRRGACYYRNAPTNIVTPDYHQPLQQISTFDTSSALITPPPTPTKPVTSIPPLYTTFKMVDMSKKSQQGQQRSETNEVHDDSDNDSGVDVDMKFVDIKNFRKRRRTTTTNDDAFRNKKYSGSICPPSSMQDLQHVNASMVYDTPTSTPISSFDISPTLFEINNWVEQSLLYSDNQLYAVTQHELQWPTTDSQSLWCDSIVVPPLPTTSYTINSSAYHNRKQSPITINLDDEEITHKYLHFEDEEEDLLSHAYIPHFIPTPMPITIHNTAVHDFIL
ncbi:unnamed protein product [Mucor hiemalis]